MLIRNALILACCSTAVTAYSQLRWEPMGGPWDSTPGHQRIASLVRTSQGSILAQSDSLFRSIDNGQHWLALHNPFGMSYDPYIVDASGSIFSPSGNYRSIDDGTTWQGVGPSDANHQGFSGAFAAASDGTLFGVDNSWLYESTDGGDVWDSVAPVNTLDIWRMAALSSTVLVAVAYNGSGTHPGFKEIRRSTDGGFTWQGGGAVLDSEEVSNFIVRAHSVVARTSTYHLAVSTDAGSTWAPADDPTWPSVCQVLRSAPYGADSLIAYVLNLGLCVGSPQTRSWRVLDAGAPTWSMECLLADTGGYFVGLDNGLLRSTTGHAPWDTVTNGMRRIVSIERVLVEPNGTVFVIGNGITVLRTRDGGESWQKVVPFTTNMSYYGIMRTSRGELLLSSFGNGVFRSTDDGDSWQSFGIGLEKNVWNIIEHPSGALFAYCYDSSVVRSLDGGVHWASCHFGIGSGDVRSMAIGADGTVWAGTGDSGVFRSTNIGASWTNAHVVSDSTAQYIWIPSMFADSEGGIYATVLPGSYDVVGSDGVLRTTDNGATWANCSDSLNLDWMWAMAEPQRGKLVSVGDAGVSVTTNGHHWRDVTGNLPGMRSDFRSVAVDDRGRILVATDQGLYRSDDIFTAVPYAPIELPSSSPTLELSIHPNPAYDIVHVQVRDANASTLGLYNILGERLLETDVDQSHNSTFDVSSLKTGLYTIAARGHQRLAQQRLVVVR
jgi:photosystem II stability/assembly factor-like uncharacterized protein